MEYDGCATHYVACVKRTTELLIILPVIPVTLRTNISYP